MGQPINIVYFNAGPNEVGWQVSLNDTKPDGSWISNFMAASYVTRADIHAASYAHDFSNVVNNPTVIWHDLAFEDLDPVLFSKTVFLINKAQDATDFSVQDYRQPNLIGCSMKHVTDGEFISGVILLTSIEYTDSIPPIKYR